MMIDWLAHFKFEMLNFGESRRSRHVPVGTLQGFLTSKCVESRNQHDWLKSRYGQNSKGELYQDCKVLHRSVGSLILRYDNCSCRGAQAIWTLLLNK